MRRRRRARPMAHVRHIQRNENPAGYSIQDAVYKTRHDIHRDTTMSPLTKLRLLARLDGVPPENVFPHQISEKEGTNPPSRS
jgi:hypothetical protein